MVYTAGRTPQVWIDHRAHLVNGEIRLIWEAVDELFPPGVTDEMATAHAGLVNRLTRDGAWSQPLTPSLPRRQRQARAAANNTITPVSGELLHGRFFRHARQHPERVALVWGEDGHLSYGQLADAALRIAASLGSLGVRQEEPVGVALPGGPEQIAAVLGVLAHGAAYVPLAGQPASRRKRITTRAGIRYTITGSRDNDEAGAQPLVYADAVTTTPAAEPAAGSPEDLAYVIFTSGSTSEPKGVELPHRAAVNTIDHVNTRFGVRGEDRGFLVSSVDFDLSVYGIFGCYTAHHCYDLLVTIWPRGRG